MYELRIITRPDGTTYESAFWISYPQAQDWTEEQEQMQRAINQFGTSA
jgi:hypothetical protein